VLSAGTCCNLPGGGPKPYLSRVCKSLSYQIPTSESLNNMVQMVDRLVSFLDLSFIMALIHHLLQQISSLKSRVTPSPS